MAASRRMRQSRRRKSCNGRVAGFGKQRPSRGCRCSHRGGRPGAAGLVGPDGKRTLVAHPALVRPHRRQCRRPRAHIDRRTGQADGRGSGRNHVWRRFLRVVCRRSKTCLRRDDSRTERGSETPRAAPAHRRLRRDHAVELPDGDDSAQSCAGAGRRLHDGSQTRKCDTAIGARAGGTGRPCRYPARRLQRRSGGSFDSRR